MKLHTKIYLVFTSAMFLMSNSSGQVLSLDTVLAIVDRQNPALHEYEVRARAYDVYAEGTKAWMAPMVGAGTFMTPYQSNEAMHENEKGAWMFSIEQDIPNPAKRRLERQYLLSRGDIEQESRAILFNKLRMEAKTSYYRWLVSEKKISVLRENERLMELMLRIARVRYPYNQGTLAQIYRAEGKLGEIQNMILEVESRIAQDRNKLKALMALPDADAIEIDTTTSPDTGMALVADRAAELLNQRSDIRRIDQTIESMRLNQQVQNFMRKPDFKLRFDHMQPIGNMPRQFSAMAMVSIPIAPWSSKNYKAQVKGMEYEIEAMQESRRATIIQARGALTGMAEAISRLKQQLENYETKIVPALQKNHQSLMASYEENREQLPMVMDAWEALNMVQLEHLDKMEEYYMMIVNYENEIEK